MGFAELVELLSLAPRVDTALAKAVLVHGAILGRQLQLHCILSGLADGRVAIRCLVVGTVRLLFGGAGLEHVVLFLLVDDLHTHFSLCNGLVGALVPFRLADRVVLGEGPLF